MESSEEDAGTATSASRRASAREKDVGLAEDVDATRNIQHESSETRASCGTPAMSEDNFDGDSVPSPSTKDTSTEAILDMIDDFIDGPGAPRRLPLAVKATLDIPCVQITQPTVLSAPACRDSRQVEGESETTSEFVALPPPDPSPSTTGCSDSVCANIQVQPAVAECTPHTEILICVNTCSAEEPNEASSSVQPSVSEISTVQPKVSENIEPEASMEGPAISPPSSSIETVQVILDTNECENQERTMKCVTSSENRDSVTVELAESTSSECSVSESKTLCVEPVSRSPLKRRLVRPVMSDRRPDSTVSSTVDSQTTDINTTEQSSSEPLTKDVSSSSDAVSNVQCNTKPEEISNLSEISICKAETSSTSRKIKLVRPKSTPVIIDSGKTETHTPTPISEKEQCQSTSSDDISTPPSEPSVDTLSAVSTVTSEHFDKPTCDAIGSQQSAQITQKDCEDSVILKVALSKEPVEEKPQVEKTIPVVNQDGSTVPATEKPPEPSSDLLKVVKTETECLLTNKSITDDKSKHDVHSKGEKSQGIESETSTSISDEKKVPPIKLNLSIAISNSEKKPNESDAESSNPSLGNPQSPQDNKSKSLASLTQNEDVLTTNCDHKGNQILENAESVSNCDVSMSDKKVPPIILQRVSADHTKNAELPSNKQKANVSEDKQTSKLEESIKQVPKLTIKLTNKHADEVTSPVSKLTVKPIWPSTEHNVDDPHTTKQSMKVPNVTKLNIKPILKPTEKGNENISKQSRPASEQNVVNQEQHIPTVTKITIKPVLKSTEKDNEATSKSSTPPSEEKAVEDTEQQRIPTVTKINIKPIPKPASLNETKMNASKSHVEDSPAELDGQQIPTVTKINIKPLTKPTEKTTVQSSDDSNIHQQIPNVTKINIKPIPKPTEKGDESISKPIKSLTDQNTEDRNTNEQIPNVTKINIKPILKPIEEINDNTQKLHIETHQNDLASKSEIPSVTKLNIKPIPKPPEKITEVQRKSSSSEISESEYSENDESTSTSDQASISDQGPPDLVPKVTIKLGKPGTESEGKFYTEKNVPKLKIKNIQHCNKEDQDSKLKSHVSPSEDKHQDKIPKITIKAVTRSDSQPLSPKLTIKPLKPPENINKVGEIPKLKICTETISSSVEVKDNLHVPKITIKPVLKTDGDGTPKTPKKSTVVCDSSDHIPVVTKLNIKPILKPTESGECSVSYDDNVPVVSKLNIKPVIKPKDNEVDSSIEDVPKIIKLNIKPLKNPEEYSSEEKDCDEMNADMKDSSIPVVTKLNIKPIIKPVEQEALRDSENQSSETGNSSDDNTDHIPVVTKLIIKPIIKPSEAEEATKPVHNEQSIPVVTKLNIKPLVKPDEHAAPSSPKKDSLKSPGNAGIPIVTKLNIKPIVKPDDNTSQEENTEKPSKQPSLLMKINMKNVSDSTSDNDHLCNNVAGKAHSPKMSHSPRLTRRTAAAENDAQASPTSSSSSTVHTTKNIECASGSPSLLMTNSPSPPENSCKIKVVPEKINDLNTNKLQSSKDQPLSKRTSAEKTRHEHTVWEAKESSEVSQYNVMQIIDSNDTNKIAEQYNKNYSKTSIQNCTLLKQLLSSTKEDKTHETKHSNCLPQPDKIEPLSNCNDTKAKEDGVSELHKKISPKPEKTNDLKHSMESKMRSIHDVHKEVNESVTKPLEISITDKITNQSSGQDSPRIILKINKTDNGASAKIMTEETPKPASPSKESRSIESLVESTNDALSPKKILVNSKRKAAATESTASLTMGKRLRSSRIVETPEKTPVGKRIVNKRQLAAESPSPPQQKDSEQSIFESKRMKLEQLLSVNKNLTITPVISKNTRTSPSKSNAAFNQGEKVSHNHSLLNNENSQKNGNSKLHNILTNLQAKQMQTLQMNDSSGVDKVEISAEAESNTSTGSSDVIVEITRVENCHPEVQEMLINENSVCDLTGPDDVSQDPLEVDAKEEAKETPAEVTAVEVTPTPRKRGRPRKQPVPENATPPPLPATALEERPQRSLRLYRDPTTRPAILRKPRGGRGRGRGRGRAATPQEREPGPDPEPEPKPVDEPEPEPVTVIEVVENRAPSPIDPTSSRIKLPRMTEALDKSVAGSSCATPLSSRRRSTAAELSMFGSAAVPDSPSKDDQFMKSPEGARPRSGRGSRGGRGRTPRNRGRGRGGGRGAMYMKETMGIYGRVCGPATTTVQLFEEETCMMDDNATPSKPSHLLDEDSQSSVKSSTNDSNKMKKSKFADLFDSNKVWTAADVKEYMWPTPDTPNAEPQVMMIQEQVAMFLGVKSFKRRYPELKRRPVGGVERVFILSKGIVSEALCDLGITAVDASEVLDIMLSDYPHKYEEYRSHQREKQIASSSEETAESKIEEKPTKIEMKSEKTSEKPEPPKVDPEKTRQDMAAAAIASAAEWNARANAWRRPACVDLQSNTVHRRRAPPAPPPIRVQPPAGFYPHALLPGQFQHWYRTYTSEQLRYFPLNTVLAAPPAPPSPAESSSDSEGSWGDHSSSSDDSDVPHTHSAKRKKLTRVKRSSQQDKEKAEPRNEPEVDLCRVCNLRLEANRKYTHERFLVCAKCNAKLHPGCVELPADTIRKCREYPWQCAECKSCCACRRPQDDDKMLFCDLCDRGFHIYCVGLHNVPTGRWHCVECAICKSCGARDPNGLTPGAPGTPGAPVTPGPSTPPTPGISTGDWHHQTKRGPGGHKVYSHSLCTPCARAYRIGRYCPLCDRSFIGPKGTMQLVICKLCDRQLHQECVRQSVSQLNVLDYTCGECRRGGITSRAAAVRVAPRTIATLFMAKRRFNKYAHRQYLASRLQALQDASSDAPEPDRPEDGDDDASVSDPLEGAPDAPPPDH